MPQSSSWEILRSPLFTRFSTKWPCINNWCKTEPFESASLWIMQHNQLQKQSITIYKHWFRIQLIQLRASNSFTKNFRQFWYCSLLGANQTLIRTIEIPGFLMPDAWTTFVVFIFDTSHRIKNLFGLVYAYVSNSQVSMLTFHIPIWFIYAMTTRWKWNDDHWQFVTRSNWNF